MLVKWHLISAFVIIWYHLYIVKLNQDWSLVENYGTLYNEAAYTKYIDISDRII